MSTLQKWIMQWADKEGFRPMLILWLGVSVTLFFFAVLGFSVWDASRNMVYSETLAADFQNHVSRLLFDYERRGDTVRDAMRSPSRGRAQRETVSTEPDTLLSIALRLERPLMVTTRVVPLKRISSGLTQLQDSALTLIQTNRKEAADAVLEGVEYSALMRSLHESARNARDLVNNQSTHANRVFNRWLSWISMVGCIFFTALGVAWMAVMRLVGKHLEGRRHTEAELKESEEKYRTLIDALPSAVLIVQEDRFCFCNPAAAAMFRLESAGQLAGESALTVVAEHERERARESGVARLRGDHDIPEHFTMTMRRMDGEEFPAELFARTILYRGRAASQYVVTDVTERMRVESALRESEEKYRMLIDALPHAVIIMRESKIRFCNPAAAATFGYSSPAEMVGLDRDLVVPERERDRAGEIRDKCLRGDPGSEEATHMTLLRRSQEEFPAEVTARRVSYGGEAALQLVILDATERRRVENALRESEERFRNLSDTAPVLIWMAGVGRHTFYFNKSWLKFTGRSVGQEYGHGWKQNVHPEDLPRCMAAYESAFESRAPFTLEYRMRHVDNTFHWVLDTGVPRFASDGAFAGYVGSCVDITSRRATEEALRESERKFRELADFLPHTIFEADERGNLTFVNRKAFEVFGYTAQDFERGTNIFEMLADSERERARGNFSGVLKGQGPTGNEYLALTKSGRTFPVVVDSNIHVVDGKPRGIRGMVIDITERKRIEQQLRLLNRALETIGKCNQAMVHADDEASLLSEICGIIVQSGGHRMAWVGYAQPGEEKVIEPVAIAGAEQGYLQTVKISWGEGETGRGPTGMAIKTCKPVVNRDIAAEALYRPWQAEAVKRGYRSSIALPLITGGRCLGALNIYSAEAEAFDSAEVQLLSRLADDLAYGISALRIREEQSQTEAALRENEMALRRTFDQSPIGAGIVSLDGHFLRVNDPFCQMLGYSAEEMSHLTFLDITHPEDVDRDKRQVEMLTEGAIDIYETDKRYVRKDGTVIWGHLSVCAAKDAAGNVLHYLPMIQDISERKRTEEALRESEARFRRLFAESAIGMGIGDETGRILDMNDALLKMLGYRREELLGRNFSDITHPDDREAALTVYREFREGIRNRHLQEKRYIRKDGKVVEVRLSMFVIRGAGGAISCIVGMAEDISESKRAETALKEQAAAINTALDGIAILDRNGRYVYLNTAHAKVYGYDCPEDLIGVSWETLYDELELKRFHEEIMPRLWKEGQWRGASVGKRRDGTGFRQEISLAQTETGGLVCVVRDSGDTCLRETLTSVVSRIAESRIPPETVAELLKDIHEQLDVLTGVQNPAGALLNHAPQREV